jgi:hypothetical protein
MVTPISCWRRFIVDFEGDLGFVEFIVETLLLS